MRANVYALVGRRVDGARETVDVHAICGSVREAVDRYEELKGRAARSIRQDEVDGKVVVYLDEDGYSVTYVAQFVVAVTEILDS